MTTHDFPTDGSFVWRRQDFVIALLGQAACAFAPALAAAGFSVVHARLAEAERVFVPSHQLTVVMVDFSDNERPPEAIPLLARAHHKDARLLALVPGRDDASFRRAFVAGARDVIALPARVEDVLRALDAMVEPVALQVSFARLRQQVLREDTMGLPAPESARIEAQTIEVIALAAQLTETRRELERVREQAKEERSALWKQLLEVMQERDRALLVEGRAPRWGRGTSLADAEERRRWDLVARENETLTHALVDARKTADLLRQELEAKRAVVPDAWIPWSVDVPDDTRPELTPATEEDAASAHIAPQRSLPGQETLDEKVHALVAQHGEPTHPGLGHMFVLELTRLAEAYDDARRELAELDAERRALLAERDELRGELHREQRLRGEGEPPGSSAESSRLDDDP